ncbi:protein of unknown function [Cupriavidus taiwanensis]|nr:protein of unknown function [Cupriavidus taiwanensis]
MQLDAVKARRDRVAGRGTEGWFDAVILPPQLMR